MSYSLTAVSPIDGRYSKACQQLSDYFSEYALIKFRLFTEIEYFISLCELPLPQLKDVSLDMLPQLRQLYDNFSIEQAQRVKDIESITNHDVKAVEYFLKEEFDTIGLSEYKEFIHFGLTSQDINNTAMPVSLKKAHEEVILPAYYELIDKLESLANEWANIPMLARTHGQPASPTLLGKEIMVFVVRIKQQLDLLQQVPFSGKFGGATGNFNAHKVAYPSVDWISFSNTFLKEKLGLLRQTHTTQIEQYDYQSAYFDGIKRINTIILDLNRDLWMYISTEYFKQKIKKGEVGSSTMPHKVNPIDFENSEGNIGIANAMLEHLSSKLPVSRLQRDLTDSTVTRNIGVPLAHSLIALRSTMKGLNKLLLNKDKIMADLEANWAVVAEAIQTILRRENYPNPYEKLKELTRTNQEINELSISEFIDTLAVSEEVKAELKKITPYNYTGIKH